MTIASAAVLASSVVLAAPASAAPTTYVPLSALINGDSVTTSDGITNGAGTPISLEQYAAERAGFTVTVVTGAQWSAMTAADFANYQVLIIGDPICSTIPTSATANASTWASVVMGTSGLNTEVGNRTLVGTDPEYHYLSGGAPTTPGDPSTAGAEHLVESGIAYAGGVSGATGVYFDTTCGDNGSAISVLNSLSSTGSGFSQNTSPPCGGSVQLIASNPVFSQVTDTDIQGWNCSDHTTYPTYPPDWQPLAVATDAPTKPTCGTDPITGTTACGEAYVLVAGRGIVVTAPDLALTPATNSDPVGGSHTVTATVTTSGAPVTGQLVSFTITGQNAGVPGTCAPASCQSDSTGQVVFTYPDTNGAGTDTINASITVSGTTEHATASQVWTTAVNSPPTADDKSVTTPQDTPVGVTLTGTDPDSDPLTFAVVTGPVNGTLAGTGANLTYTPTAGYSGPDSFTYKANDGMADSAPATVSITVTPATAGCISTAPTVDVTVSADQTTPASKLRSGTVTTGANELVLAFIQADGPTSPTQKVKGVTGGGLTWTMASRSNSTWGTTEVWQAYATSPLSNAVVTAKLASAYDGSITITAFQGAANSVGATATGAGTTGQPTATLTPLGCNSLVWASGHDWTHNTVAVAATGQTLVHQFVDKRVHDSFWTQKVDTPTTLGTAVIVKDTAPTKDRWTLAAVEIRAAS